MEVYGQTYKFEAGGECPDCKKPGSIEKYINEDGDIEFICTGGKCSWRKPAFKCSNLL